MLFELTDTEFDEILLDRLAGLDEASLAVVLASRPDVLDPPWPRRLADVTQRMSTPDSIVLAMRTLTKPEFQVLRAIRVVSALRGEHIVDLDRVAELLGTMAGEIAGFVGTLAERALAWPDRAGRVIAPPSQGAIAVDFAGLGPSIAGYLPQRTVEDLKAMARALGCAVEGRKSRMVEQLLASFRNPESVRDLLAGAPVGVAELLADFVWNGAERELSLPDEYYGYRSHRDRPVSPAKWARERGLLWQDYDGIAIMPLQVGLALRGPDYRLPFAPRPPEPVVVPVPADHVMAETATAALRIVDRICVVVDHAGTQPIPLLKSGRVGARAVKALAKDTGSTVAETRLAVELAIRPVRTGAPGLRRHGAGPSRRRVNPGDRTRGIPRIVAGGGRSPRACSPAAPGAGQISGADVAPGSDRRSAVSHTARAACPGLDAACLAAGIRPADQGRLSRAGWRAPRIPGQPGRAARRRT